jgi:hypothetical protein
MRDPEEWDEEFDDNLPKEYEEDPAFDHLRDEERNFIATERGY